MKIKSPYPYFGSKRRVVEEVWSRFGNVENYIEPFAGSLSVLLGNPNIPKIETSNDFDCVSSDTKILKDDFSWADAKDLSIGDKLIAFDENNISSNESGLHAPKQYRRFNHSTILDIKKIIKPSYKLTFSDGTVITCSQDHLLLAGSHKSGGRGWRWVKAKNLVCNRKEQKSYIYKVLDVINRDDSFEAGWLSGILDGEGHIVAGPGLSVIISQNNGLVLDKVKKELIEKNILFKEISTKRRCKIIKISGKDNVLFVLSKLRPLRLIDNFLKKISNVSLYGRKHNPVYLISKEFLGDQEVLAIKTTSNTFIANGIASHNCFIPNFWRAVAAEPDKVALHADYPVLEADLHARHRWFISPEAEEFRKKINLDPNYYDVKIAGWWVWGMNASLGITFTKQRGLNCKPFLSMIGQGTVTSTSIEDWFKILQDRLKKVRVCCGDWSRVVTPSVTYKNKSLTKKGMVGVFLDPPYLVENREDKLYRIETNVFADVCNWAIENASIPQMRIAVCGYEGDFDFPKDWEVFNWQTTGGFSSFAKSKVQGKENSKKETIWFSPSCIKV